MKTLALAASLVIIFASSASFAKQTSPVHYVKYCVLEKSTSKHELLPRSEAKKLIAEGKAERAKGQCHAVHAAKATAKHVKSAHHG